MNNDSTPTSTAGLSNDANVLNATASNVAEDDQQDGGRIPRTRENMQMSRTYDFVNNLMLNLDTLIYIELCIVYYMDCSFFRLITRVLAQAIFLTPKPTFIPPFPKHRPYIGAIVGPNLICLLLHLFTVGSEASETMRGYLHGGIIIDLIGQKGPTSKLHLALLDILIAALQCFMLAVHVERERLKAVLKGKTDQPAQVRVASSQDLDAEERGVRQAAVDSGGDIELQEISAEGHSDSSSEHELDDHAEDRERLLAEPGVQQDSDEEDTPLDIFYSGTVIIAEFHIISTLRNQWVDYADATASALQTMGYSAQYAATTSNREISAASRRVQRNVESLAGQ